MSWFLSCFCGVKSNETASNRDGAQKTKRHGTSFAKVFDGRKRRIRGLWVRQGREQRVVDFNPKLKVHLLDMRKRRAPDSQWLFPSPQRGDKDIPAKSFRESLAMARERARMPDFNFHDCRHHFISMCVMSGVDFMTIAAWVSHKDGGVLIGKVYGLAGAVGFVGS